MSKNLEVQGTLIATMTICDEGNISFTDMLKAKNGDSLTSDWLRNREHCRIFGDLRVYL